MRISMDSVTEKETGVKGQTGGNRRELRIVEGFDIINSRPTFKNCNAVFDEIITRRKIR